MMIHFEILISYHDDPSRPSIPPLYPAQGRVCGFELALPCQGLCLLRSFSGGLMHDQFRRRALRNVLDLAIWHHEHSLREYHESLLLDPDSLRQELLGAPLSPKSSPTRTFPAAADSPILMPTDKQTWRRAAC